MNSNQLRDLWWFCSCEKHWIHPTSQKNCDECKETLEKYRREILHEL